MRTAATLLVVGILVAGSFGAAADVKLTRKSAAVEIMAASPGDEEAAARVRKLVLSTLADYRNMLTRRYLADKDLKAREALAELVDGGGKKVQTGLRSTVFNRGVEELNGAYLESKRLIGELDAALVASLYRGLAMAQVVLGDKELALEYMLLFLNLAPATTRQSVAYSDGILAVYDKAAARQKEGGRHKVAVRTKPAGAAVVVDGKTRGVSPVEVELSAGGHLVQVEADGYYRGGWLKDPVLHGKVWEVGLKSIESRSRYLSTLERLRVGYGGEPKQVKKKKKRRKKRGKEKAAPPVLDKERLLYSLHDLLAADHLFFGVVSSGETTITVRGAFVSSWGIVPVEENLPRDMAVIESVRKLVLDVSDVGKHKKAFADQAARRAHAGQTARYRKITGEMESGRRELLVRASKWDVLGETKNVELFATTAADISVALEALRNGYEESRLETDKLARELDRHSQEWNTLQSKVRSLLAWDVEGALKSRRISEVKKLNSRAREKLGIVKELAKEKNAALEKKERRQLKKQLKKMDKWLRKVAKLMKKDPLQSEVRLILFRVLILEAELKRTLSLK